MTRKGYTGDEVTMLLTIVDGWKEIVECKKSDALTTKSKDEAWEKIAAEFSAKTGVVRQGKELKKKFSNLKYAAKSKSAEVRHNTYATGGGPSTAATLNAVDVKVIDMLHEKEVSGFCDKYDKDKVLQIDLAEVVDIVDATADGPVEEYTAFEPAMLRKSKSAPLRAAKNDKKENIWTNYAKMKIEWTEEHMQVQLKYAAAEDKRREELHQLQKAAIQNEEERKEA